MAGGGVGMGGGVEGGGVGVGRSCWYFDVLLKYFWACDRICEPLRVLIID